MKRRLKFFVFVILLVMLSSCTNCANLLGKAELRFSAKEPIFCVSYNAQTFFDAIEDGKEFAEFKGAKSKWSAEKYRERLLRLREVGETAVKTFGGRKGQMPDIFVVQEIESVRVIEDFAKLFSAKQGYDYVVFFPPTGKACFCTAVFSKFPVVSFEQFKLTDSRFNSDGLRPLFKASMEINLGQRCEYLTIFAVHWKSKLGENSDIIRKAQEAQLLAEVEKTLQEEPEAHILICGDFNQELKEFVELPEKFSCVWNFDAPTQKNLGVDGSFFYKDKWEQIDHMFFSQSLSDDVGLELVDFSPLAIKPFLKDDGKPNKFMVSNGKGYSDHLPICCVLEFLNGE